MHRTLIALLALSVASQPASSQTQAGHPSSTSFREVTIEANEYAFRAPTTVAAGPTLFTFKNVGKVLHEVQIFRFKAGTTVKDAQHYLTSENVPDSVYAASGSVLITNAHTTASEHVLVTLSKGDIVALVCQFRDAPKKPQHNKLGMFSLVRVE